LLRSLRPALTDIRAALGKISGLRGEPTGRVRLVVSPLAAVPVLGPNLGEFARTYPDVVLDITTDERRVDLVAGGYDAGRLRGVHRAGHGRRPRIAGSSARDRRFTGVLRFHIKPKSPRDLLQHRCVNFRHDRDEIYRWNSR
jgi:DNA-binding transcriptional LysR family regulator